MTEINWTFVQDVMDATRSNSDYGGYATQQLVAAIRYWRHLACEPMMQELSDMAQEQDRLEGK